jgi:hypothetical protein
MTNMISLDARTHNALAAAPAFRAVLARCVAEQHPMLSAMLAEIALAGRAKRALSLARAFALHNEPSNAPGRVYGSMRYMAPEVIQIAMTESDRLRAAR